MLLQANGLSKVYERGQKPFYAVENVHLNVQAGDFVSIVGRSGSGKSTFLNMMTGLLTPSSGTVRLNDVDIYGLDDDKLSTLRNKHFGYIPQGSGLLANLTVFDNLCLPFYLDRYEGTIEDRAAFLLAEIELSHLEKMYPANLSGGELRRIMIARALINSPELIIADEPTSDLDVETTKEIMDLFGRINKQGTTIVIVTHELATVEYGNRVLTMESGQLSEHLHVT